MTADTINISRMISNNAYMSPRFISNITQSWGELPVFKLVYEGIVVLDIHLYEFN